MAAAMTIAKALDVLEDICPCRDDPLCPDVPLLPLLDEARRVLRVASGEVEAERERDYDDYDDHGPWDVWGGLQ